MSKQGIVYMETQKCRKLQDLEISDDELAHQALVGNQDAFEVLVRRYERLLFPLIYRYVGEYQEAHDVLQQVWLQLYLSLPKLHPHVHLKPWLFTVAHNRSLDVLRRRRLLTFSEVETGNEEDEGGFLNTILDTSLMPEELVEQCDLQQAIQYAIQALPRTYRSVVLLYYKEQMNYTEIAQVLKVSVSTVKARFYRAKPFLRAVLTAQ